MHALLQAKLLKRDSYDGRARGYQRRIRTEVPVSKTAHRVQPN